jgi:general secretion pathway protein A
MYESFYKFKDKPFDLHPDPDYLYMSQIHEDTYAHMEYAILENKGFVIITGEIGSGKTTLINYLLSNLGEEIEVGLINNTNILPEQFLKLVCKEFELEPKTSDKAELLDIFSGFLITQFSIGKRVVLIIDEAQNLSTDTIEEIRMLSNIETEKHNLIQIVLVGQPELRFKLKKGLLNQLSQRVTVHCHLTGLERDEVEQYIKHRLMVGGADRFDIFKMKAIDQISQYSRGIPRLINVLCDSALVYGFADGLHIIDTKVIENVYAELKTLGTFAGYDAVSIKTFFDRKRETNGSTGSDLNWDLLKEKINLLDIEVSNLREKIESVLKKHNQRDTIVIELFKMLKDNFNRREKLFHTLYRKIQEEKLSNFSEIKDRSSSDKVSNLSQNSIKRQIHKIRQKDC